MDCDRNVVIVMTLTAPGCPVALARCRNGCENAVASVRRLSQVKVTLTFDPPWDEDACRTTQSSRSICSNGAH